MRGFVCAQGGWYIVAYCSWCCSRGGHSCALSGILPVAPPRSCLCVVCLASVYVPVRRSLVLSYGGAGPPGRALAMLRRAPASASLSASSLPGMPRWPGVHRKRTGRRFRSSMIMSRTSCANSMLAPGWASQSNMLMVSVLSLHIVLARIATIKRSGGSRNLRTRYSGSILVVSQPLHFNCKREFFVSRGSINVIQILLPYSKQILTYFVVKRGEAGGQRVDCSARCPALLAHVGVQGGTGPCGASLHSPTGRK